MLYLINYPCGHIVGGYLLHSSQPCPTSLIFEPENLPLRAVRIIKLTRLMQIPLVIHHGNLDENVGFAILVSLEKRRIIGIEMIESTCRSAGRLQPACRYRGGKQDSPEWEACGAMPSSLVECIFIHKYLKFWKAIVKWLTFLTIILAFKKQIMSGGNGGWIVKWQWGIRGAGRASPPLHSETAGY